MKILLKGGAGFIGSHLVASLAPQVCDSGLRRLAEFYNP